jgi:S1-C subfamily serine protease
MKHQNKSLWQQLLIIPVIVLIFCTISTALAQTAPQIAEKTLAATVYLEMQDSKGLLLGFGSGFFVRDNLIATNYHVIEGAARGTAKLVGKFTTYTIEGVTATDKTNDLALLKVTAPGIKPLPLGNSTDVKIGETVYVAGNPKGLEGTFSNGIISSLRDKNTKERLQMTAPISPGSSGGPVLNSKGEVIGVSFMTLVGGQNLNFAIPSRYLTELLTKPATPLAQGNRSISAKTYFMWGNTKYYLGDYKGAITDYTQAIRLNPDYAKAYNNRGIAKALLNRTWEAKQDVRTALRLAKQAGDTSLITHIEKWLHLLE